MGNCAFELLLAASAAFTHHPRNERGRPRIAPAGGEPTLLPGFVLACPDPHNGVEEGLSEEGEARDLAAVLLLHADAGEAGDPVDNEEADAVEHQVPEVLRALAVVGDLHGLGEVQHEDDLHEHVVANRAKIGKVCEQSPNAASKNGRPVKQKHLDRNMERQLVPAY